MKPSSPAPAPRLEEALAERFGTDFTVRADMPGCDELTRMASHRSHRRYTAQTVDPRLLRLLFACSLPAPSKSDLQQADIIHVADRTRIKTIVDLIPDMPWINEAPVFLAFCANNRRIRKIGAWRGKPFANDHLDHFMNAAVDAGLVMMNFVRAAAIPQAAIRRPLSRR